MIPSWSHSRVVTFEQCAFRAYLQYDAKVPEPERPLPPGKKEHANDRGSRIHDNAEMFVRGKIPKLCPELQNSSFVPELEAMRLLFPTGAVHLEGEWGMNRGWDTTGWRGQWIKVDAEHIAELVSQKLLGDHITPFDLKNPTKMKTLPEFGKDGQVLMVGKQLYLWEPAWLRLKLDALVFCSQTEAIAIDYKSGRKFGNEIKHGEQLQLYQLVTFLRFPKLETVHTELWYIDQDDITIQTFQRKRGLLFRDKWDKRGSALTNSTEFKPNPGPNACRWCQYGPWNGGQCVVGKK